LKKLYTSIVTYEIKLNDDDDILSTLHEQVEGITPVRDRPGTQAGSRKPRSTDRTRHRRPGVPLATAGQAIAEPHRRFIEIFEGVREVRDLFQPLPSKTERIVYMMNDCMLVRPRAPSEPTSERRSMA